MSAPRQILPGSTYMVSRRTTQLMFLLRPAPLVNLVFQYCLAYAVHKYGMRVHGFCVLSNHYHIVVTDPKGDLPAFLSWLNEFLAKAFNAMYGRWENFWAPGSYSLVRLEMPQDILEKLVYALLNPVRAGLVARCRHWPGAHGGSKRFGVPVTLKRPNHFFRSKGPMPERIAFSLERPPGFEDLSDEEWHHLVKERLAEREEEIRQQFRQKGRSFLGSKAALKVRPTDSPCTREPRCNLDPQVAARDTEARIRAIHRLSLFRVEYRRAYNQWKAGNHKAVFPYGIYALRDIVQVQAIPPP